MEHQLEVFISKSCHVVLAMSEQSVVIDVEGRICVGFQPEQARVLAQTLITQANNADKMEKEIE